MLSLAGTAAWSKHAQPVADTETADAGDFVQPVKTLSITEQLTELEMIVFAQDYEDDPLLQRVSRLTHALLPSQEAAVASLSLEAQVGRQWQALQESPKYNTGYRQSVRPQMATMGGTERLDRTGGYQQPLPSAEISSAQPQSQNGGQAEQSGWQSAHSDINLNRRIMAFAAQHFGQQVGNGECWTLAEEAMAAAGAIRPEGYTFGRELGHDEEWWPGDIIQFTRCKFKETLPGNRHMIIEAGAPNHTAIFGGMQNGSAMIAQQNYNGKKTVAVMYLDFHSLVSGSYKVFRPLMLPSS
jgi:hypothetical protein